jgi:hypothetical protein
MFMLVFKIFKIVLHEHENRHGEKYMKMDMDMDMNIEMNMNMNTNMNMNMATDQTLKLLMSYIGYRYILCNFRFCRLKSDIGGFDIRLSPIWFITDIRMSAILCLISSSCFVFLFHTFPVCSTRLPTLPQSCVATCVPQHII